MNLGLLMVAASLLAGCISMGQRDWHRQHVAAVAALKNDWLNCIEKSSYDWLDDSNEKASAAVKANRGSKNYGQVFIEVLAACQAHLTLKGLDLSGRETKRFIDAAYIRFSQVAADIQRRVDLQSI